MAETKTLYELGEEYEREVQQLKRRIAEKRCALRGIASVCSNEAYELKRELKVLYSECREAAEIAEYLKNYYQPHKGRREIFRYK
ncbi:MAG: hypothetical protein IJE74_01080 [Clostridia bacterium]|nr:hypothetical protein [Clostridia bacterium]